MNRVVHRVTLTGAEHFDGKPPAHAVGPFLTELPYAARGAVAMALSNRSSLKGKKPAWLDRVADIRFTGVGGNGQTTLYFEAPRLGEAAAELYRQGELWETRPDGDNTAFDLLGKVIQEVADQNTDSDDFDTLLLKRLVRFRKAFNGPFQTASVETQKPTRVPPRLDAVLVATAAKLCSQTPHPKRARLVGVLDMVRASNQTFGLRLEDGQEVPGVLMEGQVEDLARLLNQRVLVLGKAVYRPSGRMLRLETDEFRPATPQDAFFTKLPAPSRAKLDVREMLRPQPQKRGLKAVFGKWPGDETDEQVAEALRELS